MRGFVAWMMLVVMLMAGCGLRPDETKSAQKSAKTAEQIFQTDKEVSAQSYLDKAINFLKEGKIVDAIQHFDEAIKNDPLNVSAYLLLGQTYIHLNEFDRAADSFKAALNVAPDQGEIYYMLAITNGLRGRKDLAVTNAEKALLLFSQDKDGENFKRALALLQGLSQE